MIIAVVLIAIIGSFAIPKFTNMNYNANLATLKSQLALIQNGIINQKRKNILLSNIQEVTSLDNAVQNISGEKLFDKVIDFTIIATDNLKKEPAKWLKTSNNSYIFYLRNDKSVLFSFEDGNFLCKSDPELCKEIE